MAYEVQKRGPGVTLVGILSYDRKLYPLFIGHKSTASFVSSTISNVPIVVLYPMYLVLIIPLTKYIK